MKSLKEVIVPLLLGLLQIIVLLLFKYFSRHLPLSSFDMLYIGNMVSILLASVFVIELVYLSIADIKAFQRAKTTLLSLLVLGGLLLTSAIALVYLDAGFEGMYIVYITKRTAPGVVFAAWQLVHLYILVYLGSYIAGSRNLIPLRAFVNSLVIILLLLILTFFYVTGFASRLTPETVVKGKVGVVFGAAVWSNNKPSTLLMGRVNKAVELYRAGKIDKVQLTGSNAPGELAEAEVAKRYITGFNVAQSDILIEKKTTSTAEQVAYIRNSIMGNRRMQEVVVISDGFHLVRISEMCRFYGIATRFVESGTKLEPHRLLYYRVREAVALLIFWFFAIG